MDDRPRDLCARLRFKGMFVEVEPDPTVRGTSDGFCWCARTMTCLGPDGAVADRDRCGPGRVCHEPLVDLAPPAPVA